MEQPWRRRRAALALCVAVILPPVVAPAQQQSMSLWVGTWKRNAIKSTYSPGPPPSTEQTLTLEIVNGLLHVTEDGFNTQGQPTHAVFVVRFDGTENTIDAVQGLTRAYRWIDERMYEGLNKVKGEHTTTIEYALARDGKTHTATTTGISAQGQLVHNIVIYEKQ